MKIHKIIGPGQLEGVYHECMEIEFHENKIEYESEPELYIYYEGKILKKKYRPDFRVMKSIIVEIKANDALAARDEAQLINSLKISKCNIGILINFGEKSLKYRRFINSRKE